MLEIEPYQDKNKIFAIVFRIPNAHTHINRSILNMYIKETHILGTILEKFD